MAPVLAALVLAAQIFAAPVLAQEGHAQQDHGAAEAGNGHVEHAAEGGGAVAHAEEGAHSPLEQFRIQPILEISIGGYDLSFTNSSLFMAIAALCVYGLVMLGSRRQALVPGRLQSVVEMAYEFIAGMISDNVGKEGRQYFPVIFTLFMFILFGNLIGLVPGAFTFTSHIVVTFAMAVVVVSGITVIGFMRHGARFFGFFVPEGAPKLLLPLIVPIEVLSYCVRPISLSMRLFINMMAGHTMLHVFGGFVIALGIAGVAPLLVTSAIYGLEIAIAFLQAYVFTVLTCIYLNDAIHMH